MKKKLPLYKATLDDTNETGMFCISLVEDPAVESNFLAFDKQKELLQFEVENEEKRMVRGLVMAADMPIYRISPKGEEYYIEFDADTIREMAQRYFKNNLQNQVDTDHNEVMVEGVEMQEMFIKDTENGINPKGFENYADGSLFAQFKVNNDEIWQQIKDGEFKGFSLMGVFTQEPVISDDEKELNEIMELIEKINKKINNK